MLAPKADGRHARSARCRATILRCCRELMAAGTFRPSMREVARAATVDERTVARFGTHDELMLAAVADVDTCDGILDLAIGREDAALSIPDPARFVRAIVLGRAA